MKKTDMQYYIKQADLAHELYKKENGKYKHEWRGAGIGFKLVVADLDFFKKCMESATASLA